MEDLDEDDLFKDTDESKLFRKFQNKWLEYFPVLEEKEEVKITVTEEKIELEGEELENEKMKHIKRVYDFKSKKFVDSDDMSINNVKEGSFN